MKIKIILDEENYIQGFAEVGDFENSIEVVIPNELIDKQETYNSVWNGKEFVLGELLQTKELLRQEFTNDYMYYKYENGVLTYDKSKKQIENQKKVDKRKEEIRQKIMELTNQKEFYKSKNWDTVNLEKEILDLEKELNNLK